MIEKIKLNGKLKKYLLSIDDELKTVLNDNFNTEETIKEAVLKEASESLKENIKEFSFADIFVDSTESLLYYYNEYIFELAKAEVIKKIDYVNDEATEVLIIEENKQSIYSFSNNLKLAIENCFSNKDQYEEIITLIISFCIKLFKSNQISLLKNNNIEKVYLETSIDSCPICQARSGIQDINNINIEWFHPFCKLNINVISSKTIDDNKNNIFNMPINLYNQTSIINFLKINVPDLITDKIFHFVNSDEVYIEKENDIFLSNQIIDFKYYLVYSLLKDKCINLADIEMLKDKFAKMKMNKYIAKCTIYKSPFISDLAEVDYLNMFNESIVAYILNPAKLKLIDNDFYEYIKKYIFNDLEFINFEFLRN